MDTFSRGTCQWYRQVFGVGTCTIGCPAVSLGLFRPHEERRVRLAPARGWRMYELRLEQTALSKPNETCLVTAYNDPTNLTNVKYAEQRVIKRPKTHMNKIEKITTKNNLTPLFNIVQLVQCITTRSAQHNPERLKTIKPISNKLKQPNPNESTYFPPPRTHLKPTSNHPNNPITTTSNKLTIRTDLTRKKKHKTGDPKTLHDKSKLPREHKTLE